MTKEEDCGCKGKKTKTLRSTTMVAYKDEDVVEAKYVGPARRIRVAGMLLARDEWTEVPSRVAEKIRNQKVYETRKKKVEKAQKESVKLDVQSPVEVDAPASNDGDVESE